MYIKIKEPILDFPTLTLVPTLVFRKRLPDIASLNVNCLL